MEYSIRTGAAARCGLLLFAVLLGSTLACKREGPPSALDAAASAPSGWAHFESKTGLYGVNFPAVVLDRDEPVSNVAEGNIYRTYVKSRSITYAVEWTSSPRDLTEWGDKLREEFASADSDAQISDSQTPLAGRIARRITVNGLANHRDVYLIGGTAHSYKLSVSGVDHDDERAQQFFSSFILRD